MVYTHLGIMIAQKLKRLVWVASTKADLNRLPASVIRTFGYALYLAQIGHKHPNAKPLQGFGSAGVLEVVEDWQGNAYRAIYTVRFSQAVFVLHVFQKKAKRGIATPKSDIKLVARRMNAAERIAEGLS